MKNRIKILSLITLFCWANVSICSRANQTASGSQISPALFGLGAATAVSALCFWQAWKNSQETKKSNKKLKATTQMQNDFASTHRMIQNDRSFGETAKQRRVNFVSQINDNMEKFRLALNPAQREYPYNNDAFDAVEQAWIPTAGLFGHQYNPYGHRICGTGDLENNSKLEQEGRLESQRTKKIKRLQKVSRDFVEGREMRIENSEIDSHVEKHIDSAHKWIWGGLASATAAVGFGGYYLFKK